MKARIGVRMLKKQVIPLVRPTEDYLLPGKIVSYFLEI